MSNSILSARLLILFSFIFISNQYAQENVSVAIHPGVVRLNGTGFGSQFYISRNFNDKVSLNFGAGIYSFNRNDDIFYDFSIRDQVSRIIPINLSGKYYFGEKDFKPYVTAAISFNYFFIYHADEIKELDAVRLNTGSNDYYSHSSLSYGIGIGVKRKLSDALFFDVSAVNNYEVEVDQFINFNLGMGYIF
ncbi:MAG: outer membrane beta-barrel protein [Ignavibacteria bacterium]|jgi:outer membrane protein W